MIRTMLFATLLCPASALAAEVGIGTTLSIEPDLLGDLLTSYYGYGYGTVIPGSFTYPSLDIRVMETVIQIHILESLTTAAAEGDAAYIGANAFNTPVRGELGGKWSAFAGLGGSLDFVSIEGDAAIVVGPIAPIGVRFGDETRVALYAIPGLNLIAGDGDTIIAADGALVASVWF